LLESFVNLDNPIVLRYLASLNAGRFRPAVRLFEPGGALQPPFELPLVGRRSILAHLREEYRDVEFLPEKYRFDPGKKARHPVITVLGKSRIPWFGSTADIDQVWRFFLLPEGLISLLAIDTIQEF
jgi:hypothetical protein